MTEAAFAYWENVIIFIVSFNKKIFEIVYKLLGDF